MSNTEDILMQAAGIMSMLRIGGRKVSAYNDLLEDEWQGRQSALEFLYKAGDILSVMMESGMDCLDAISKNVDMESLMLSPIVDGVAGSWKGEHSVSVDKGSTAFISANVHLLQRYLLQLVEAMTPYENVTIRTCDVEISSDEISSLRSELKAGNFTVICLERKDVPFELKDYRQCTDYCLGTADMDSKLLRWSGMAAVHGGEFCLHKDGVSKGAMLLFPLAESSTDTGVEARDINGRRETILLVDDEDMIWDVVQGMLCGLGYNVLLANDGKEAVEIYTSNAGEIDLVLMDMMMPVMNARDAFPLLKEADENVRVLLMSGYVEEADVQDLLASGAMGFMRKPYSLNSLAQKIRSILDKEPRK